MRCYMNGIYRDSDSQIYGLMLRQFVDRIVIFGRDFYEAELDHQLLEGSEFALLLADLVFQLGVLLPELVKFFVDQLLFALLFVSEN